MSDYEDYCQATSLEPGSRPIGRLAFNLQRLHWYLKTYGLAETCSKIFSELRKHRFLQSTRPEPQCSHPHANAPTRPRPAALNLQPGELVEVLSEAEIRQTLDVRGRSAGLYFMPGMKAFCGQRLRVFKRVSQIALENETGVRKIRDTVLLAGALCDGGHLQCDRSCFYYWREWWLRRVPPDSVVSRSGDNGVGGENV